MRCCIVGNRSSLPPPTIGEGCHRGVAFGGRDFAFALVKLK
jgi:hypothetical protein